MFPPNRPRLIAPLLLFASVLKPLDDTRMREKLAATVLAHSAARVHVLGRGPAPRGLAPAEAARVQHHAIFGGARLSLDRLRAQLRYWRLLRQVQPDLAVVHAPELLPLTLLWQALGRGRQFVYDIQENYALNIGTQGVYRGLLQRAVLAGLRRIEALAARRAAALLLAEASYADELPFLRQLSASRVLVLENKYQPPAGSPAACPQPARPVPGQPLHLLFSGTISELNGVREALALTEALGARWPGGAVLTVIGFCQQPALLAEVQGWAAAGRPVRLVGGAQPVPHRQVLAAIDGSHLGLVLYRPHPSTARCRPTKLFEYLAHGLPVLVPDNPLWANLVRQHGAGLVWEPGEDIVALAARLAAALGPGSSRFYPLGAPPEVQWSSEELKFGRLLETIVPSFTFVP